MFVRWLGFICHAGNSFDASLAFEDAKVIPPFFREDTDDTDDTDGTDDKDDTDDTDDTDHTDDTDYIDDTDDTFWILFGYFLVPF